MTGPDGVSLFGFAVAQDLCARLCHDLVGPFGTLAGALEMLDDPEAADLAREAAAGLRARLQWWRAACGAGTGPATPAEIAELLEGVLNGRVTADLSGLVQDQPCPAAVAQLLLVAGVLGAEALPRGGVVRIEGTGGVVSVRPEGRVLSWPSALTAALEGQAVEGPRAVLGPVLVQLATLAGWRIRLADDALVLRPG